MRHAGRKPIEHTRRYGDDMHNEAMKWVVDHGTGESVSVLDIGGRNINGTARDGFPNASKYVALDILPGEGVDIVANAADWEPTEQFDVVVSTEVFEHTPEWPEILRTMFNALKPNGLLVLTMAGPGRTAHSGHDGAPLDGSGRTEYYGNVEPRELESQLYKCNFANIEVDVQTAPCDVRAIARKPNDDTDAAS